MQHILDICRQIGRKVMRGVARFINTVTRGRIHPNAITIIGLVAHISIAMLIGNNMLLLAAGLLLIFGLFDTLDGELARLQKRESLQGMFLDSVTDRIKEVMLYIGLGYLFIATDQPYLAAWAVAACGLAVTISYINAWGEVVLTKSPAVSSKHQANKVFRAGILSYDIRIFLLIIGLAFTVLPVVVVVISILALITIMQRIVLVLQKLS